MLRRIATAIRDNAADFIGLECLDIGLPIAQMRGLAARAAENFDFFASGDRGAHRAGLPASATSSSTTRSTSPSAWRR